MFPTTGGIKCKCEPAYMHTSVVSLRLLEMPLKLMHKHPGSSLRLLCGSVTPKREGETKALLPTHLCFLAREARLR